MTELAPRYIVRNVRFGLRAESNEVLAFVLNTGKWSESLANRESFRLTIPFPASRLIAPKARSKMSAGSPPLRTFHI
jgi:hypothetical protein